MIAYIVLSDILHNMYYDIRYLILGRNISHILIKISNIIY